MKHFEKQKSWKDEVTNLKDQLNTMTIQNRKTPDEEMKITKRNENKRQRNYGAEREIKKCRTAK